jgi:hypothetical protein
MFGLSIELIIGIVVVVIVAAFVFAAKREGE